MAELGEALLSVPAASDEEFTKTLTRSSCSYVDQSERFKVKDKVYAHQYAQIYFSRLMKMTPLLKEAARKKWGGSRMEGHGFLGPAADIKYYPAAWSSYAQQILTRGGSHNRFVSFNVCLVEKYLCACQICNPSH